MPIARLNRGALQLLAEKRLEEGRILLENSLWTGAYYMTGLAVECALKACLARGVSQYDYPDKKFVDKMYQHDLQRLVELDDALWANLQADMNINARLDANWRTVKDWKDEKRYDIVDELEARGLYEYAAEPASGVMRWIRGKW